MRSHALSWCTTLLVLGATPALGDFPSNASHGAPVPTRDAKSTLDVATVLPAGASLARSLAAQLGDFANVKNFGASPSATGATNRAAFQAALNYAGVHGGGTVRVPAIAGSTWSSPTVYDIAGGLTVPDGVRLQCDGQQATILRFTYAPGGSTSAIAFTWGYRQGLSDCTLRYARAIRPATYADNGSGVGLDWPDPTGNGLQTAQNTVIEHVTVQDFAIGARLVNLSTWVKFYDVLFERNGTGTIVKRSNKTRFTEVIWDGNQSSLYVENGVSVLLDGCTVQANWSKAIAAVQVKGSRGTVVRDLYTERNQGDIIFIADGPLRDGTTHSQLTTIQGGDVAGAGYDIRNGRPFAFPGRGLVIADHSEGTKVDGTSFGSDHASWGNATRDIEIGASTTKNTLERVVSRGSGLSVLDPVTTHTTWMDSEQAIVTPTYVRVGGTGGPIILSGNVDPNGNVSAPVGSVFFRTNGGRGSSLYVKESGSGNTGWAAK